MSSIGTDQIKVLRDATGVSIMECRKALEEAGGDIAKATILLKKKSSAAADKKADRELKAGVIAGYVHQTGSVGALVELRCETDFVGKNDEFKALARDIAMHVAALRPTHLRREDVSAEELEHVKDAFRSEVESSGKPADIQEKMLEGKVNAHMKEIVLLEQSFIKNPELTIAQFVNEGVQKFGEKMELSRFSLLKL